MRADHPTIGVKIACRFTGTAAEAEQHAKRLYAENCGPYEFNTGEETVTWFTAREVQS